MDELLETGSQGVSGRADIQLLPRTSGDARSVGWIRLNTNEIPVPPSPLVVAAVSRAALTLNRYADPQGEPLRQELASLHHVLPENIFIGGGADAILEMCFRAYCAPGATVALLELTYPHLYNLSAIFSASVHQTKSSVSLLSESGPNRALTFLVNPNSPTGEWISPGEIVSLAGCSGLIVVDEAYAAFAPESAVNFLVDLPNFLVVRTFSKSHGLAGARIGYAVAHAEVIDTLSAAKDPYPVGSCAIAAAVAALHDPAYYGEAAELVMAERERLSQALRDIGWTVAPSSANFVFASPPERNASDYFHRLEASRILVRRYATAPHAIRISIGTAAEHAALMAVLTQE